MVTFKNLVLFKFSFWNSLTISSDLAIVDHAFILFDCLLLSFDQIKLSPGCSCMYRLVVSFFPGKFQSTFHSELPVLYQFPYIMIGSSFYWILSIRSGMNCSPFDPFSPFVQLAFTFFYILSFDQMHASGKPPTASTGSFFFPGQPFVPLLNPVFRFATHPVHPI